jgi:hypothetical protein
MSSMISMRLRSGRNLLSRRLHDHLMVAGVMIVVSLGTPLRMSKLFGGGPWFGEWIADVVGDRLSGTVISAIPHPAGQLRNGGAGRVIGDGGSLRHGIRLDLDHSWTPREHRLGHVLGGCPVHACHLENCG